MRVNNEQFEQKYNLYKTMIYNIAYTYLKNQQDSEDVVQDVFIKYLQSDNIFPTLENEKYWLIRVTINHCKSQLTSSWKKKVIKNDELVHNTTTTKNQEMFNLVSNLPLKYKEVVILFYYEDLSIKEISDALRLNTSTVKKRLQRARDQLKKEFNYE